ncbi:MAG: hypothetical protein EOM24_34860, partial [Chloroflexia bacterium]|nr:hypothetical protein [Chloroflexia bacterium]
MSIAIHGDARPRQRHPALNALPWSPVDTTLYKQPVEATSVPRPVFIFGTMLLLTVILMKSAGGPGSQSLRLILPINGLYAFAAHRLSTIRNVDRVYVFDQGRLVEEGPYEQ